MMPIMMILITIMIMELVDRCCLMQVEKLQVTIRYRRDLGINRSIRHFPNKFQSTANGMVNLAVIRVGKNLVIRSWKVNSFD